ncbi:MAG TPA: hypothetical protein VET85_13770 [Stellaceae bacterium]|nr:hypothetical protein [Stellaceae bacterium]
MVVNVVVHPAMPRLEYLMPVGSVTAGVPPQVLAALQAISNTQSEELAVATQLEQGFQSASANPDLGQNVNLSV